MPFLFYFRQRFLINRKSIVKTITYYRKIVISKNLLMSHASKKASMNN